MAEAGVDCDGCHARQDSRIGRPDAASCVNCHEESYKKTFEEWRAAYRVLRVDLETALAVTKRANLGEAGRARLGEIENLLRRLDQDGSSGIHNSQFIQDILTKLAKELESIE